MRKVIVLVGVALMVAGCAKDPGFNSDYGGGALGDRERLILRVTNAGGFLPPGSDQAQLPEFTLLADGSVITQGPQIAIFPGPALPNVLTRSITAEGIDAIVKAAREAGLDGPDRRYDHAGVADAATTTFTFVENDGTTHRISAYALGFDEGGQTPGSSEKDASARETLSKFREKLGSLESWLPAGSVEEERPYEYGALRIVVRDAGEMPEEEPKPNEVAWPLDTALANFGDAVIDGVRCGVLDGDDARTVLERAKTATQITRWMSKGNAYNLAFRPQLPDEEGCEVEPAA